MSLQVTVALLMRKIAYARPGQGIQGSPQALSPNGANGGACRATQVRNDIATAEEKKNTAEHGRGEGECAQGTRRVKCAYG